MRAMLAAWIPFLLLWGADDTPLVNPPPPPDSAEAARILESARELALQYTSRLPNFICTETVRRYNGKKNSEAWEVRDTLTLDLGFSEKGESYKLLTIDGKPTTKRFDQVGGMKSNGEFGSLLHAIFLPKSATQFHWERWSNLRGHPAHVYSYRIEKDHSEYSLKFSGSLFKRYHMVAAFGGLVYVDRETNQVMRVTDVPEGIPSNWPIMSTPGTLDYGFAEISGQKFLLPLEAESRVLMRDGRHTRNVIEFGNYRKFSSEATVTFEK